MATLNDAGTISVEGYAYQDPNMPQIIKMTAHRIMVSAEGKTKGIRGGVWVNMLEESHKQDEANVFTSGVLSLDEAEALGTALLFYVKQAREAENGK